MPSPGGDPRREVKIAAVVAILGGSLFLLAGLTVAGSVGYMVSSIVRQYHVSIRNAGPGFREIMRTFAYLAGVPLALGIAGIITGRGLLRLKPWARWSAVMWAIVSTLLCFIILRQSASEYAFRPRAGVVSFLMLFLVPINVWWLFLFLRPSTKKLFGPSGFAEYRNEVVAWWAKDRFARFVVVTTAIAGLFAGSYWLYQRNSAMNEITRARDALATVKSWHFHTVRYLGTSPPETIDKDFVCPSFQRVTSRYQDAAGMVQTRDGIYYFGNSYSFVDGHWQLGQRQAGFVDPGIFECSHGPIGSDESSLPMADVLEDGSVKRGELVSVNGEWCREYKASVPTPHDPDEKEFQFTICINEQDHLPRETRRTPPNVTHEGVSRFSRWNAMTEPELPPDFPK